jgi:cytochrome c
MTDQAAKLHITPRIKLLILSVVWLLGMVVLPVISPLRGLAVGSGSATADNSANAEQGKLLFDKRCAGCHSLDQDREGPRLRNVYGRTAGSISTFKYSEALKSSHITWNDGSLDKWLTDPESLVPDTDMEFHVPKADERAAIIRFLRLSSGNRPGNKKGEG